ncbi:MAG: hypothetical protein Kow0069_37640 [Promethearchaeota archaeon]
MTPVAGSENAVVHGGDLKYLAVGVPAFALSVVLLVDWYVVGTTVGASLAAALAAGTWRRRNFRRSFSKTWPALLGLFLLANPWPPYWTGQFQRRWLANRTKLLQPDHPVMAELNASFQAWHLERFGVPFDQVDDFEAKVRAVDLYVRQHRFRYTLDQVGRRGSFDHLPTIDEVLATEDEDGYWHDDCDGISIVTTSFLLYLGFNAYVSEVTYHYHPMVFRPGDDPKTSAGYLSGVSLYRGSVLEPGDDKKSYYLFNQTEVFVPPTRPLGRSFFEIFTDGNFWKRDLVDAYSGKALGTTWVVGASAFFAASLLLGFGAEAYVRAGSAAGSSGATTPIVQKRRRACASARRGFGAALALFAVLSAGCGLATLANSGGPDLTWACNPLLFAVGTLTLAALEATATPAYGGRGVGLASSATPGD